MSASSESSGRKDFFVSYNKADKEWAVWIAWKLEEAGYTTIIQAWDFQAGSNFILEMDKASKEAKKTIAVLSPDYLAASYTHPEWAAALAQDPTGAARGLVPVRVRECDVQGLLLQLVYIDLVGSDETSAGEALLAKIRGDRLKPSRQPGFPGAATGNRAPAFPSTLDGRVFVVPQQRNLFFTGREDLLEQISRVLKRTGRAALSGLGGIGKTDTAIEYAFRHRDEYKFVLWTRAESRESLVSGMVALAVAMDPKYQEEKDQTKIVDALREWLKDNSEWLLIMDNADDLGLIRTFVQENVAGHVLLTTRAQATGTLAERVEVPSMPRDEGAQLLLRRARLLKDGETLSDATEADASLASQIAHDILGALPLALDQAGAYIEETGCGLAKYRDLFRKHGKKLLERRGELSSGHPDPIAVTWKLSFENTEKANPAAADLLRLCAFLHPDSIPEEILTKGASELGPELSEVAADDFDLDDAIREALRYSLLRRDAGQKTLGIHRLVQAVIQDSMGEQDCRLWATRAASAVNAAFPDVEFDTWPSCERLVPSAEVCPELVERFGLSFLGVGRLLGLFGGYLLDRGRLRAAESVLERGLGILEKVLGREHPELIESLNRLQLLRNTQGRTAEAESLRNRSGAILIEKFAHLDWIPSSNLGDQELSSDAPGWDAQAVSMAEAAIEVLIKGLGPEDPEVATGLCILARCYKDEDLHDKAEQALKRALAIREKALEPDHLDVAEVLSNLAGIYSDQSRYDEAKPLYHRVLTIRKQELGEEHPDVAVALSDLGELCTNQASYDEAKPFLEEALIIRDKVLGPLHPDVLASVLQLATVSIYSGRLDDARLLLQRGLTICDVLGESPNTIAIRQMFEDFKKKLLPPEA
jgi:tetratricopeptide (TPR) repeat protein